MERDQMNRAVVCRSVPVRTSTYLFVPVCTSMYHLENPVLTCTVLYHPVRIVHLEPWVTVTRISRMISPNCDITCDIELHHAI